MAAKRATTKGVVPVLKADASDFESEFAKLANRRSDQLEDVEKVVRKIIDRVRDGGEERILRAQASCRRLHRVAHDH